MPAHYQTTTNPPPDNLAELIGTSFLRLELSFKTQLSPTTILICGYLIADRKAF